jgi:N-acetylneuraminate synthase/N,N'-diacetyllegionaminate synthase
MQHVLVIAEAGVNHNGKLETALRLCDAAKEAGADVIKFQTWITEAIITKTVEQAKYQEKNTKVKESQFDMLKKLELSFEDYKKIKLYCDQIGIAFASTADDPASLNFLIDLGIPFIKIGSGDVSNIPYLRYIGSKNRPIILSTGMSTFGDVDTAVRTLNSAGADQITLLHCTTNYPCPKKDVNLKAMLTLKEAFQLPVGYSDHTTGIEIPIAAAALGATVIEKHFTLDRNMPGPDHKASTEPNEFKRMIQCIRNVELAMGYGKKTPTDEEKIISNVVLKRIIASTTIHKGEVFTEDNLTVKRNDKGLSAKYWDLVIGKKAVREYQKDFPINEFYNE